MAYKKISLYFAHKIPGLLDEMMIDNIKTFADSLTNLAYKYKNQCLATYAGALLESANSFDIANLQIWLKKFMNNFYEVEK